MDWPMLEGLLFCWSHCLDILWGRDPVFTWKPECFHVPYICIYWHSKRANDGMMSNLVLSSLLHEILKCISYWLHFGRKMMKRCHDFELN